jgi:DNA-binding transcriptional LysR family regulator
MLKEGSYLRNTILGKCKEKNIAPNIVLESNQIETIKGLITKNVGISFLLDFNVKGTSEFLVKPLAEPMYVDVGLAWKKDRYISRAAQSFMDFCKGTLSLD